MASDDTSPRPPSSRGGSSGPGWVPPSVDQLQALLPQYEIISMLGHGGMGAVYKGKQKSLDRLVAIKILPPGLEDDEVKFAERFKNEARTMARMNHPGIVSVYDFGEIGVEAAAPSGPECAEGSPLHYKLLYFVMEYVDGTDVAQMIKGSVPQGGLPQDHALAITAHVCDALAYAHANGVVHRDIKPANILINMQGQVKVADFGLAKMEDPSMSSGLTKTGMAMGTPDFVAPEALIMGYQIDGRADLYAVGVMLYQMLTGEIPRGMFMMPGIKSKGEIDPRFDAIIAKAMQTDRECRYQTATELRRDLDVILTTPRVKQDASKVVAAVPRQAVAEAPDKRSAALKPVSKGPARPGAAQRQSANVPVRSSQSAGDAAREAGHGADGGARESKKSKTGIYIGIGVAAVVAVGGFFMLGSKSGTSPGPANPNAASSASAAASGGSSSPIKVVDAPKSSPAARFSPSTEPWTDRMNEHALSQNGSVSREGAAWRVDKLIGVTLEPPTTDGAVRALISPGNDGTDPWLAVRALGSDSYRLHIGSKHSIIYLSREGKVTNLDPGFRYPQADFISAGRPVEFELRVVGTRLTAKINGETVVTAADSSLSAGRYKLQLSAGTRIHGLQTLDLSKTTVPAPAVAGGTALPVITGWQDVMSAAKEAIPRLGNTEVKEDNGWLVASNFGHAVRVSLDNKDRKDIAMRGRVRGLVSVNPRGSKAGYYPVTFRKGGTGTISLFSGNPQKGTVIASFTMSRALEHDFLVTMTGPDIRLWVDGTLAATARDTTVASGTPTLTLSEEGAAIRDLAIAELPADFAGKLASPSPPAAVAPAPGGEQWRDWLAEKAATSSALKREADGWRVTAEKPLWLGKHRDVAVRAIVRGGTANYWKIQLRYLGNQQGETVSAYVTDLRVGQRGAIYKAAQPGGDGKGLTNFNLPPGFALAERHTLEVRLLGDTLTCILDGQEVASVKDDAIKAEVGDTQFVSAPGTLIEKLEYRELPADFAGKLAPVAASASPSSPTVSVPPVGMPVPPPAPAPATPALPPELAVLDAQFLKLQAERVAAPFDDELAKLNTSYLGGIGKKIAEEKAAGRLDAILALEAEQTLLANKQPVPESDDVKTPASLKALRAIYREQYAKLTASRAANLKALTEPLDKRLAQMETDFTKADRVADAKTVRAYREALSEGGADAPAFAANGPTGANTPNAALAGASALPKTVNSATSLALRNGITNTLGMKLVPVPGTEVLMCIHETRYKDYAAYAAEAQGVDVKWKDQTLEGIKITDRPDDHPVMQVSWEDAQKFCAWLGKKESRTYRLPTDREWSFAVGLGRVEKWGKDTTPAMLSGQVNVEWPWGDNFPPRTRDKAGNYSDASHDEFSASYLKGYTDGYPTTAPVMSFKPNKLGIYDLGGNVFEWVEDWYDGEKKERVMRGASWSHADRNYLLSSGRYHGGPSARGGVNGFRVVWVPGPTGG